MTAYFYYLKMSLTRKRLFPGSPVCQSNTAVSYPEMHMLGKCCNRDSLIVIQQKKERQGRNLALHCTAGKKSWQAALRIITKIRSQEVPACSSEGPQDSGQARR
jgi:hypothetical protein